MWSELDAFRQLLSVLLVWLVHIPKRFDAFYRVPDGRTSFGTLLLVRCFLTFIGDFRGHIEKETEIDIASILRDSYPFHVETASLDFEWMLDGKQHKPRRVINSRKSKHQLIDVFCSCWLTICLKAYWLS